MDALSNGATTRTVTLPSGKTATIRKGTGRDLREAQRTVGKDTDSIMYALVARRCMVDGKQLLYEDVLDQLEDIDVMFLTGEVMTGLTAVPQQPSSPDSSTSDSELKN